MKKQRLIDGVVITPLKKFADNRGAVMHMLRADSPQFDQFGEVYFSSVYAKVVKAWHLHKLMTINYAVPMGSIRFVLYDSRRNSPTHGQVQEIEMGEDNYVLVSVPPLIWNGFVGIADGISLVANLTDITHSESEIERCVYDDPSIPYIWPAK